MVAVESGASSARRKSHTKLPLFLCLINCITTTSIPNLKIEPLVNSSYTNNWIIFQYAEHPTEAEIRRKHAQKPFNFLCCGQRIDHLFCHRPRASILLPRLQSRAEPQSYYYACRAGWFSIRAISHRLIIVIKGR
jgi:hypothetical protein